MVASLPAVFRAARVSRDQAIGQVESDSPWWISSGSVTRSKKFTAERFRQKAGLRDGSPYVRRMVVAIGRSFRVQRLKLSTAFELTGANTTAAFTRPGCVTSTL